LQRLTKPSDELGPSTFLTRGGGLDRALDDCALPDGYRVELIEDKAPEIEIIRRG